MTPVLSLIEQSLKSGHRAWIIGEVIPPKEGEVLPKDALRPDQGGGWTEMPYYTLWAKQMWSHLMSHIKDGREETPKTRHPVNVDEWLRVFAVNGWRD